MSVLSDKDIRQRLEKGIGTEPIEIDPMVAESQIQPASVDLTLGGEFSVYKAANKDYWGQDMWEPFDMDAKIPFSENLVTKQDSYNLLPGEFVLGSTYEQVKVPEDLVGRVEGKSSLGRLGLLIHATAGFIDPGFHGRITLEMYNLNHRPITLRAHKPICQISFLDLTSLPTRAYGHPELGSRYQGQNAVTPSRIGN